MQYFNIQMASQLSGVATATIRAWEKRYQAVKPSRADNKHRLYSEEDIEKLTLLSRLTDFGQNIGKIAHLDIEELKRVYTVLLKRPYKKEEIFQPQKENISFPKTLSSLLLALSTMKLDVMAHEINKAKHNSEAQDIALHLISPLHKILFQESDKKFSSIQIRVLTQMLLLNFSPLLADKDFVADRPPILLAAPENQPQQLALLGSSLLCKHFKKNFVHLGPSLSASELADVANLLKSEVIMLETSVYQLNDKMNLDQYLDELNRLLHHTVRLYLQVPQQVRELTTRKNCFFIHDLHQLAVRIEKMEL